MCCLANILGYWNLKTEAIGHRIGVIYRTVEDANWDPRGKKSIETFFFLGKSNALKLEVKEHPQVLWVCHLIKYPVSKLITITSTSESFARCNHWPSRQGFGTLSKRDFRFESKHNYCPKPSNACDQPTWIERFIDLPFVN